MVRERLFAQRYALSRGHCPFSYGDTVPTARALTWINITGCFHEECELVLASSQQCGMCLSLKAEAEIMTRASHSSGVIARVVLILMLLLFAAGIIWHGISEETLQRLWRNLLERPSGSMAFRFLLQPVMATIAALHDGLRDARLGRSPYLWTIATVSDKRVGRLNEGLLSTGRIILLGLCMDAIYQFIEFNSFYPNEALLIAILLAFVPYLMLRGPVARIALWWRGQASNPQ